jgi:hypothetical protein
MPLAFRVAPANENERKHAVPLLSEAVEKVRAEAVVCDKQYSSGKIRESIRVLGAEQVIPYPANQQKGVRGVLRVDKKFRVHGPEKVRRLYRLRSSIERVNSRLQALLGKVTFKGLKAAAIQVSYAVLGMLFVA